MACHGLQGLPFLEVSRRQSISLWSTLRTATVCLEVLVSVKPPGGMAVWWLYFRLPRPLSLLLLGPLGTHPLSL